MVSDLQHRRAAQRRRAETELIMHTERLYSERDLPRIPMRHGSWFVQLMMVLAVACLAGMVYSFWQLSWKAPAYEEPAAEQPTAPVNEQSLTGSRER